MISKILKIQIQFQHTYSFFPCSAQILAGVYGFKNLAYFPAGELATTLAKLATTSLRPIFLELSIFFTNFETRFSLPSTGLLYHCSVSS